MFLKKNCPRTRWEWFWIETLLMDFFFFGQLQKSACNTECIMHICAFRDENGTEKFRTNRLSYTVYSDHFRIFQMKMRRKRLRCFSVCFRLFRFKMEIFHFFYPILCKYEMSRITNQYKIYFYSFISLLMII